MEGCYSSLVDGGGKAVMAKLRLDPRLEGGQPRWCVGVGGGVEVEEDR